MDRIDLFGLVCLTSSALWAQIDNRTILGGGNEFLSAGAFSIRMGQYDEGIRPFDVGRVCIFRSRPQQQQRRVTQRFTHDPPP